MVLPFLKQMREKASYLAFDNLLYNWTLGGGAPDGILVTPPDSWPGDAERGRWLCSGAFAVDGAQIELHGDCWEPVGIGEKWLAHLHGFEWLRDLRTLGGDQARRQAREMIESWMRRYPRWHGFIWQPGLTGQRLANWIALYPFFGGSAGEGFQERFLTSLIRQARHLSRCLPGSLAGLELLQAARGLAYAGLAFAGRESWLEQALDILEAETAKQILPDGGHISRNPAALQEALRIFLDIKTALLAGDYPVPAQIDHTIDRMAQALRFFRYPDKGMALFNSAQEGEPAFQEALFAKANARGKVLRSLPASGYERLTLGRSVVMVDTGASPVWPYDQEAHAAPLAFEFLYGRERVFVNCGVHPLDPDWQDVLRGTAAHNSLALDYRNACEIRVDGHFGRKPRKVTASRDDQRDAILLDMAHDGYIPLNGITHRRRLYLGRSGHDLRGEESLTCSVGLGRPVEVVLRFHLHPRVLVSLIQDGREALLRLSGGAGWRFFYSGGHMQLENSIYLGTGTRPRKTKQLVIYGRMESDHALIKWALQRESR